MMDCCQNGVRVTQNYTVVTLPSGREYRTPDGLIRMEFCTCPKGLMARYRLPPAFLDWRLKDWTGPQGALKTALEWYNHIEDGAWLIVSGGVGLGKTFLAVGLYKRYVDTFPTMRLLLDPARPRFWRVPDLLEAVKAAFDTEREDVELNRARTSSLLVLDDLGAERETEYALDVIRQLVAVRYEHMLATIITTNLDGAALSARLGPWVMDRLRDRGYFVILDGKSKRQRGVKVYQEGAK